MAAKKAVKKAAAITDGLDPLQCSLMRVWILLTTNPTYTSGMSDPGVIADGMGIPAGDPARDTAVALIKTASDETGLYTANSLRQAFVNIRASFQSHSSAMNWQGNGDHPSSIALVNTLKPSNPAT